MNRNLPVSTDPEAEPCVFGHTKVKIRYQDYQINSDQGVSSGAR